MRDRATKGYTPRDFDQGPFVVFYEVTQACDLVCKHCRACAQADRAPDELEPRQSRELLTQLASFPRPPMVVLTGGDPLKRPDVFELVEHGIQVGLTMAMTPSATPLVTDAALARLQASGLHRLALSLDGADAATHDAFRGVRGSFQRTMEILSAARGIGLPLQVNTTIAASNFHQVDDLADLLAETGIVLWSVFFLVPVGRGQELERVTPQQYEEVFARLWRQAQRQSYGIKTTEAPQYRRFVLQRRGDPQQQRRATGRVGDQRAPLGINDGRGVLFISQRGEICPSGFLPIVCGRFPEASVVDVYQHHPTFQTLRDVNQLQGKCGCCEYRSICGGSRARAYAVMADMMAAEPDCPYLPSRIMDRPAGDFLA
jgi:radical SAM protein